MNEILQIKNPNMARQAPDLVLTLAIKFEVPPSLFCIKELRYQRKILYSKAIISKYANVNPYIPRCHHSNSSKGSKISRPTNIPHIKHPIEKALCNTLFAILGKVGTVENATATPDKNIPITPKVFQRLGLNASMTALLRNSVVG